MHPNKVNDNLLPSINYYGLLAPKKYKMLKFTYLNNPLYLNIKHHNANKCTEVTDRTKARQL